MKLLFFLFGIIFCLVSVSGRNLLDDIRNEKSSEDDSEKQIRDPTANQMRHRRRSRQSFYDYNYHDYRRDFNRQQDDLYSQILRLLDEIASNVRQPSPPPPQPIYIPYPVPYYVPRYVVCNNNVQPSINTTQNIPEGYPVRWPFMEDERQNFGLEPGIVDTGNSDGSRPINLDPIPPSQSVNKPPQVGQGTTQTAKVESTTQIKKPGPCKAAVLTCCDMKNLQDQRSCFLKYDCPNTFETGHACKPEVIKLVLEEFAKAYAPIKNF